MVKKGGITDHTRAAAWFIKWWREQGGHVSAKAPLVTHTAQDGATEVAQGHRRGWGFDFEWSLDQTEVEDNKYDGRVVQRKMEECIDAFERTAQEEEAEGGSVSSTQQKKRIREQDLIKRATRTKARLAAKRGAF